MGFSIKENRREVKDMSLFARVRFKQTESKIRNGHVSCRYCSWPKKIEERDRNVTFHNKGSIKTEGKRQVACVF
jgi:hypothetical protein